MYKITSSLCFMFVSTLCALNWSFAADFIDVQLLNDLKFSDVFLASKGEDFFFCNIG